MQNLFWKKHFCLSVFQFFTKPKPPKGYYIFGDVGKRYWPQSFKHASNFSVVLFSLNSRVYLLFQAREKRWWWTCSIHMLRLKRRRGFISTALCWTCTKVSSDSCLYLNRSVVWSIKYWSAFLKARDDILKCLVLFTTERYSVCCQGGGNKLQNIHIWEARVREFWNVVINLLLDI